MTVSTVSDPPHTHSEHKDRLCQSFADTDNDFCDVALIKEKLCDQAGTRALCYVTERRKHF